MRMLHKVYIYRDKGNLPEEGWFQACFMCYTITSGLKFFNTVHHQKKIYEIYVYLCPFCQKKTKEKDEYEEKLKNRCIEYINKFFFKYP